jgi:hypothetical protein
MCVARDNFNDLLLLLLLLLLFLFLIFFIKIPPLLILKMPKLPLYNYEKVKQFKKI